jgi:RepB DNA-primase from phage plasmid
MKNLNSKFRRPASPTEVTVVAAVSAQLAALQPDQVRITLMHSERKETSYNMGKSEGPAGPSGEPGERFFTAAEVIGLVPFLLSENGNRRGYNVFMTPFSEAVWYILLDDIVPAKLAELEGLQLTPQMLIESSPQRYQGLFMLPKALATKDEANALFRMINARHGDPKISGLTHPFRAVGFRNMKPKYQKSNGHFPFAGMVWGGKPMPDGLVRLLEEAKALVRVIAPKERRSRKVLKSMDASAPVALDRETTKYAREHYRQLGWRYGRGFDVFKADFMLAERLLARRLTADRVAAALMRFSPDIQARCGGKAAGMKRYITKTVLKAEGVKNG